MSIAPHDVTGLVLAGGQGARMGGVDKGLQLFRGRPLVWHTLQRLQAQVGATMVSANRHRATYQTLGVPVWPDEENVATGDYAGPLAGVLAGLAHCATPWLLTVPCDSPFFPTDLATRLAAAAHRESTPLAMAVSADGAPQPVFCLLHTSLRDDLAAYLRQGGRKVREWMGRHRCAAVAFDQTGDDPLAFANANTLEELRALEGQAPP